MTREQYLVELKKELADLPDEERWEAIADCRDYIMEEGREYEEEAMRELGTPQEAARQFYAKYQRRREKSRPDRPKAAAPAPAPAREEEEVSLDDAEELFDTQKNGVGFGVMIMIWLVSFCLWPILKLMGGNFLTIFLSGFLFLLFTTIFLGIGSLGLIAGGVLLVVGRYGERFLLSCPLLLAGSMGLAAVGVGMILFGIAVWYYGRVLPGLFRCAGRFFGRLKGGRRRRRDE